jgi:hypothetical protein
MLLGHKSILSAHELEQTGALIITAMSVDNITLFSLEIKLFLIHGMV